MIGDVQPLGEHPEVDSWLGVMKLIDGLRDGSVETSRQLTAALKHAEELRRENVALTAQRDYARNQADTWRMAAVKGMAP